MDATQILKKFIHIPAELNRYKRSLSRLSPPDWRELERLVRAPVKNTHQEECKKLSTPKRSSKNDHNRAVFYSTHVVRVARDLAEIKQKNEEEIKLQKLRCSKRKRSLDYLSN
ncbi:hypothetical protein Golomagni_05247 [Golovinomyces magnicellulatus]|nr:hypothetical protein Golomagni_05247 [Golovinomyces magnicellulatus]